MMMILLFVLNLLGVSVNTVVFLAMLYIGDGDLSLNEEMITQGYASGHMMVEQKQRTLKNSEKFVDLSVP